MPAEPQSTIDVDVDEVRAALYLETAIMMTDLCCPVRSESPHRRRRHARRARAPPVGVFITPVLSPLSRSDLGTGKLGELTHNDGRPSRSL